MTWKRGEQGELGITWLLDLPGRQNVYTCQGPIRHPINPKKTGLRNYQQLTLILSQIASPHHKWWLIDCPYFWGVHGSSLYVTMLFQSRCWLLYFCFAARSAASCFLSADVHKQGSSLQHGDGEAIINGAVVLSNYVKLTYLPNLGWEKFVPWSTSEKLVSTLIN